MNDPTGRVLARLEKVRKQGRGWLACCPAHPDRSPSLSISETEDGTVLLKCWAGCATAAVLDAIGLEFSDLFAGDHPSRRPHKRGLSAKTLAFERLVYAIGCAQLARREAFNAEDKARFALAVERLTEEGKQ